MIILSGCSKEQPKKEIKVQKNINQTKAYNYSISGKTDSAFKYYSLAKDEFLIQKDSIGVIYCLLSMAIISTGQGDYFGGQEISLAGLPYLNEKNKDHLWYIHSNYNNIGLANYRLKNYSEAIRFYNQALKFATIDTDRFIYLNNKAKVYEELKNFDAAINIYARIVRSVPKETINYARALANLAAAKWLQNPDYNAEPELLSALAINDKLGEKFGQNFCYARLADFYSKRNNTIAVDYAKKMLVVAKELSSPDDQLEALYKLVKLSSPKATKQYFVQYEKLSDSLQSARARAKNQFALIRYDTLKLQKDNTEKKYQIARREALIVISLIAIIALTGIFIIWYRKRKQKIELETQNAIRESRLKTSKKVHDVVANGLYRVMTEIENTEGLDREEMLDRLDQMYQKSRDISYEVEETKPIVHNFSLQITALLQAFTTPTTKVIIKGNTNELWTRLNDPAKHEIEHVLQELMVNMKKHSHATAVELLFEQKNKRIYISYIDNGVGMPEQVQYKNGLRNTGNRIEHIGGEINFDTKLEKGLKILIVFPVV
ncbi:tetratricopeptide repeat-containing sensor histidine kinase [Pedobacter frigiditerrae]|uniref:histidine kinase n=1 Tax=Pedobacter frigiditerrae TaxID=2530452 RepID=A0A4R0MJC3_9SPHI|nr:tetratricopeptide repeat-containing sensor histidine kinase [Pedobacter frigiditerrae]TCC86493.1 tetratricopeptide repeat-containing sensor histidine kinase [Pedobacter frigiditerrae]